MVPRYWSPAELPDPTTGPGQVVVDVSVARAVEAAGGGVGSLLAQLARAAGARVVGAARGPRKLKLIRDLGADAVVDYSDREWTTEVREVTGSAGPDVVFEVSAGRSGGPRWRSLPRVAASRCTVPPAES